MTDARRCPAPHPIPEPVVSQCVATASRTYGVPELVIRSILKVEGGQVGTMSRNTNGSFDLGPMQINTINLKIINKEYPFLTWRHITYNPCVNIMVGTWFLKSKIRNRGGVIWEGWATITPSPRASAASTCSDSWATTTASRSSTASPPPGCSSRNRLSRCSSPP